MFKKIFMCLVMSFALLGISAPTLASEKITLTKENTVVLRGEVTNKSVDKALAELFQLDGKEVYLYITSPGGSIMAGIHFMDKLKASGKKVTCIADIAASMAFVILQACETRYVMNSSIIMQHVATYGIEGEAPKNLKMVQMIHRMLDQMDKAQAERLGLSLSDFRAQTRDDWWLLGDEAIKANAADGMAEVTCDAALSKSRVKEEVPVFIFVVEVVWYGCPLHRSPEKVDLKKLAELPNASLLTIEERESIRTALDELEQNTKLGDFMDQCSKGLSDCSWVKKLNSPTR